jgi:hypothetical protein
MNRLQWSLGGLILATVAVGVGLAAVISNSHLAASLAFSLNLGLLCLAITGAICGQGVMRTFWVGFAVFGVGYGLAVLNSPDSLVTEMAIEQIPLLQRPPFVGDRVMAQWTNGSYYSARISAIENGMYLTAWDDGSSPTWVSYAQLRFDKSYQHLTAHNVLGPMIAFLGGWFCAWFFARGKNERRTSTAPSPSPRGNQPELAPPRVSPMGSPFTTPS